MGLSCVGGQYQELYCRGAEKVGFLNEKQDEEILILFVHSASTNMEPISGLEVQGRMPPHPPSLGAWTGNGQENRVFRSSVLNVVGEV